MWGEDEDKEIISTTYKAISHLITNYAAVIVVLNTETKKQATVTMSSKCILKGNKQAVTSPLAKNTSIRKHIDNIRITRQKVLNRKRSHR